jgi:hypothetical protein
MRRFRCAATLAVGVALFLSACASSMTAGSAWRDPTYEGPPFVKVLVFAWVDRPSVRRTVEDVFVAELASRGVAAVASYTLIPDARDVKREVVVEVAKRSGVDSVLVTRVQGVEIEVQSEEVQPFVTADPADMWPGAPIGAGSTFINVQSKTADLMSNLFDAGTGKMVWWGKMDAAATNNAAQLARGMARTVLSALRSAKLL